MKTHQGLVGSQAFKEDLLEQIDQRLGEHHSGEIKRETAERRAERILAEELQRLSWNSADLQMRLKSDPAKLQIAARLRAETTVSLRWIAARLSMGTWKSATTRLHAWKQTHRKSEQTSEGNVILL